MDGQDRISQPVHTLHLVLIKMHLFIKRSGQSLHQRTFDGVLNAFGVHHQTTIVRHGELARPNATRLTIHFNVSDRCQDGTSAVCVGDALAL